ncbi:hypothetical protein L6452_06119 [Arctium lappa]|uniref:Uncharacterized protein n=1 Tax=Arctium lappa TaxID=4217 RepID=A0ACB9EIB4_ARCLA|nr:hypothetical protein L6452_06119 [Arctium lappa]
MWEVFLILLCEASTFIRRICSISILPGDIEKSLLKKEHSTLSVWDGRDAISHWESYSNSRSIGSRVDLPMMLSSTIPLSLPSDFSIVGFTSPGMPVSSSDELISMSTT